MPLPFDIVDAHHHLWNPVTRAPDVGYVWLTDIGAPKPFGDPTAIQRDYLLEEFLGECAPARIAASVHLQADGGISDPVAETRFVDALAQAGGHELAMVGFVDLASDNANDVITRHLAASRRFVGVRQILSRIEGQPRISFAARNYLDDPTWREQFRLLSRHRLSFDLQCYPEQMSAAAEFLANHQDVPVIIDHAGSPWDQSADGLVRWHTGLAELAALPQMSIKLCGFGMFDKHWNAETILPLFETIEALFGRERMLFASNFPVEKLMRPYGDLLRDMVRLTALWDESSRQAFFSGNARRVYRL
ncbi:MAG: amidohydrolase family protein [Rhizobiaceae bacterium]